MQSHAMTAPGEAHHLKASVRQRRRNDVAVGAVLPKNRVQATPGGGHQAEAMTAGVGIFPSDQALSGGGGVPHAKNQVQTAGGRHGLLDFEDFVTGEAQDRSASAPEREVGFKRSGRVRRDRGKS